MGEFLRKSKNQYLVFAGICALVFLSMKYLVPVLMPFLLAFLFVTAFYTKLCFLNRVTKIGKGFWAGVLLLFLAVILGGILWYISCKGIDCLGNLIRNIEEIETTLTLFIHNCCGKMESQLGIGSKEMENYILNQVMIFAENVQMEIAPKVMGESFVYVKNIISTVACVVVAFIATILLAKDYDKIKEWANKQRGFSQASDIVKKIGKLFSVFIKAQIVILFLISIVASLGFLLLKVNNPLELGMLTGILDLLPFIGTGIILIPFSVFSLINGEIIKAVGGIALYALCALIREFLEPKLIGKKMGILPIGILIAIYTGIKLYGLKGIVLGPISILLVIEIMKRIKEVAIHKKVE